MASLTRREFLRGAIGVGGVSLLLATGCSSTAPASAPTSAPAPAGAAPAGQTAATQAPAAPKGVTLRALVYPYPVTAAVKALLPEYEKQTGVKVEWEEAPYADALSKQMTELVAKTDRYDLFTISNKFVGAEAGTGQMLVLEDMIAKAGANLDWADFIPKQQQMHKYQGKQYGLPMSCNICMGVYRKDIFEQEGIKVPALGTSFTHDEWLDIAKRLTKDGMSGTTIMTQAMQVPSEQWMNVLMSAGGRIFDEKLTPVLNSKIGVETATWMRQVLDYSPKDALRFTNVETNEAMQSGGVATMTSNWASRIPMIEDKAKSKVVGKCMWTTLPYAGWDSSKKVGMAANDGWAFTIPKGSKHQQEAFDLAVWSVSKEKQLNQITNDQQPPTRLSVFNRPELAQKFVWLPVMKEQLNNAYDFPNIPEWSEILEKVGAEIHGAWSGQQTIQAGLDKANKLVTDLLKERNYPVGTWSGPKLPWE